jgi:glycosyltransferase involved in cell wall biosynthesis
MRVAVYTDYPYQQRSGQVFAERAFALFLAQLAPNFERFTVIGRLAPPSERGRYPLGEQVEFVALPYYRSLTEPWPVIKAMAGSVRRYWRALDDTDCVWLLGPHPVSILFAALALVRRRRIVLGVRQDLPQYVRNRHPNSRLMRLFGGILERSYRWLGRRCDVIAVGPALADNYRRSRRVLELTVSLVDEADIVAPESRDVDYSAELEVLSVGRLDTEKNPLMLADVLSQLARQDRRWQLTVCGEGSLAGELDARLRDLDVSDAARIRGYVTHGDLTALYRGSQFFLHVSWTEGLPQILFEAFAAALPVVATDVGGVREACGDAVTLIPPGDPAAAAEALLQLSADPELRLRRIEAGHALVRAATIQAECARVTAFLGDGRAPARN